MADDLAQLVRHLDAFYLEAATQFPDDAAAAEEAFAARLRNEYGNSARDVAQSYDQVQRHLDRLDEQSMRKLGGLHYPIGKTAARRERAEAKRAAKSAKAERAKSSRRRMTLSQARSYAERRALQYGFKPDEILERRWQGNYQNPERRREYVLRAAVRARIIVELRGRGATGPTVASVFRITKVRVKQIEDERRAERAAERSCEAGAPGSAQGSDTTAKRAGRAPRDGIGAL